MPSPSQINMIGEGTVFEGTLRSESDLRISGRIVGKLHVGGKAIVATEGVVEGEMMATNAEVAGSVQGEIRIKELLVLKGSARVDGNIEAARLIVEEGSIFNGKCQMTKETGTTAKVHPVSQANAQHNEKRVAAGQG
ncbi:MAG: polymer-forming cytoskeletal protein [Rhodothermales bacterium]